MFTRSMEFGAQVSARMRETSVRVMSGFDPARLALIAWGFRSQIYAMLQNARDTRMLPPV